MEIILSLERSQHFPPLGTSKHFQPLLSILCQTTPPKCTTLNYEKRVLLGYVLSSYGSQTWIKAERQLARIIHG